MRDQIRALGTDTAIYGISTIVGRFLNFLLVFFYTNVLAPGDYGMVAYVYSLVAFLTILYGFGMEAAYFKYASTREHGTDEENFSTPLAALFVSSATLSAVLTVLAPMIAPLVAIPGEHQSIIVSAAWILCLDTLTVVPFAALRLERRPRLFAFIKVLNIVINVAANLILLLVYHKGVEGIFLSGVIASGGTLLILVPVIVHRFRWKFTVPLFRTMLRFGLPYVPAGLASMMIQVVDRPILRALTDDATVGIYQANYRLGIFMMLIVSMYDYAWRPFFLSHANDPDAETLFSRILTYFVLVASTVTLVLSLFMEDFVRIRAFGHDLINPSYWSGLPIVPVVLLAYLFLGVYNNLIAGIYIKEKSRYLPAITFTGAGVNVVANFLLIPSLGMMGAAIATVAAYAGMALTLYIVVRQFYPVPYEWGRIGLILLCGVGCYVAYLYVPPVGPLLVWKTMLVVLFCGALVLSRAVRLGEVKSIVKV
jgi:O-antigen/teichoic acid export membrane protein